ncbi:MAG: hypothetical protein R3336_01805 [Phycisphaeraceae bacterium]|nr:hypothetical protein [Phycisphaeraceae bacterium]
MYCGERALMLDHLPEKEQKRVLRYYGNVEDRVPFTEYVWVCQTCHKVEDDMVAAAHNIRCKECGVAFSITEEMECSACGVRHNWVSFEQYGKYRFLVPRPWLEEIEDGVRPKTK